MKRLHDPECYLCWKLLKLLERYKYFPDKGTCCDKCRSEFAPLTALIEGILNKWKGGSKT